MANELVKSTKDLIFSKFRSRTVIESQRGHMTLLRRKKNNEQKISLIPALSKVKTVQNKTTYSMNFLAKSSVEVSFRLRMHQLCGKLTEDKVTKKTLKIISENDLFYNCIH